MRRSVPGDICGLARPPWRWTAVHHAFCRRNVNERGDVAAQINGWAYSRPVGKFVVGTLGGLMGHGDACRLVEDERRGSAWSLTAWNQRFANHDRRRAGRSAPVRSTQYGTLGIHLWRKRDQLRIPGVASRAGPSWTGIMFGGIVRWTAGPRRTVEFRKPQLRIYSAAGWGRKRCVCPYLGSREGRSQQSE